MGRRLGGHKAALKNFGRGGGKSRSAPDERKFTADNNWGRTDHLMGSRGNLEKALEAQRQAREAEKAKAALVPPTAAEEAAKSKLSNAKARHIRKKQRRYERRKAEWEASHAGADAADADAADADAAAGTEGAAASDDDDREATPRQAHMIDSESDEVPHALRAVPSKAERRKAIKKLKKLKKAGASGDCAAGGATGGAPLAQKRPREEPVPAAAAAKKQAGRTLEMGVQVRDLEPGTGQHVEERGRVRVEYVGRLETAGGHVFDRTKNNKPFTFRVGRGEVIKGWDIGIKGMRVGQRRRITVPPKAGYGAQQVGEIPPNSTLLFDVKVVGV
jgi:FKBP-type peptidyl-prolyl cis-trans isomerase